MTKAGKLYALAERCEQATGLNRDLNCDIAMATGIITSSSRDPAALGFTGSLDAAMTLVPEGWWYGIYPNGAEVAEQAPTLGYLNYHKANAATPALAVCAAALRARAEQVSA